MHIPTSTLSRTGARAASPTLVVRAYGVLPYVEGLALQETVHAARCAGRCPDTLLLLEHAPVVTLGRGADRLGDEVPSDALRARGISIRRTERGGRATYHGPGQLVGYPVVSLRARGGDAHAYVHALEQALVEAAAAFGVAAETRAGLTGVWVEGRKLGSIGVQIRQGVTLHGFALNVDMDLSPFELIAPCGVAGLPVTSLARELGQAVDLRRARRIVIRALSATLAELPRTPNA
ncbi:MAG: lipoyl(octanoyl) transferase LipB [Actinobacteria bacterium]|nr:lipoyl(octanoyl) transferase LipB [Actinomycetota bacterium]